MSQGRLAPHARIPKNEEYRTRRGAATGHNAPVAFHKLFFRAGALTLTFCQENMKKLRSFFSLSGSFSRTELLVATVALYGIATCFETLRVDFPESISAGYYKVMIYSLYPIWGIALGKRSRDLGTTFTYGMLIGMVFPLLGVVFLFQAGKKAQTTKEAEQVMTPNGP